MPLSDWPSITINRRHQRTNHLMNMVMHHMERFIPTEYYRDAARTLEELFHTTGAYIVTDADRAAAGLPMRDHNGLTLDELAIIERQMIAAMLERPPGYRIFYEADGTPVVEKVKP